MPTDAIAQKNLSDFGTTAPAELDDAFQEDEDEDDEDAEYDIDDRSEAPTNASSPQTTGSDSAASVPAMPSGTTTTGGSSKPHLASHDRAMSSSSDLREDMTMRFHDPAPLPPRLSSRHSYNDHSLAGKGGLAGIAPEITHHRLSASTARRRARGEEGDRDHIHEPLETKRQVGGRPSKLDDDRSSNGDRAFAVLGHDSDSSLSEGEM